MARGAVVVLDGARVALIERVTPERQAPYYLFPGGQLEPGETPEQAARREAEEELGLQVQIGRLLAIVLRRGVEQHYYLAEMTGGTFGRGQGEELRNTPDHPKGTYRPIWLERQDLTLHDVRPRALAALLASGVPALTAGVLRIDD